MLILNDFNDIKSNIHGKFENDEFDVKQDLISVEKLVKIILSFMNGDHENGYIIIGIAEKDGKANADDVVFPSFPKSIKMQENEKKGKTLCSNLQAYIGKVESYLKNNTIPKIDTPENFLEIKEVEATNSNSEKGNIILIKVSKYKKSLVQYSHEKKFYARLPQNGADDYGSQPMDGEEISKRMKNRYYSKVNLQKPIYYNSIPAVPELTVLFDFIYQGNSEQVKILLGQIPTLTQMTDSHGYNALLVAIVYKRQDIINLLLNVYKMSVYHRDNEGNSPLLAAGYVGNLDFVKEILSKEPSLIRDRDRSGNNIFLKACSYGHINLINYLAQQYPTKFSKAKNNSDWNVLEQAIYHKRDENILQLIISLNTYNKEDLEKALGIASQYNNSVAQKFLEEKINSLELNHEKNIACQM